MESASLRVLLPFVAGSEKVECVLDTGSQIVSMAKTLAERLGVAWDPDVRIYMQSANGQLKESEGLARNVRFTFGDMTIYLQVHVIDQPAYQVLLGRPFDILTESIVQNKRDGSQSITIRDPNQQRRITLPTYTRGAGTYHGNKNPVEEDLKDRGPPLEKPLGEGAADFRGSLRI
jgi:hypothetical protein